MMCPDVACAKVGVGIRIVHAHSDNLAVLFNSHFQSVHRSVCLRGCHLCSHCRSVYLFEYFFAKVIYIKFFFQNKVKSVFMLIL